MEVVCDRNTNNHFVQCIQKGVHTAIHVGLKNGVVLLEQYAVTDIILPGIGIDRLYRTTSH